MFSAYLAAVDKVTTGGPNLVPILHNCSGSSSILESKAIVLATVAIAIPENWYPIRSQHRTLSCRTDFPRQAQCGLCVG